MDKIIIPASITLEKCVATRRYKWKSDSKKISTYKRPYKRAAIRFTCKNLSERINKTKIEKRQISIDFISNSLAKIKRVNKKGISIQGYSGKHPHIQIVINKVLPKKMWKLFEESHKKTLTIPLNIEINLKEWREFRLTPDDFLLEIEKESKSLMRKALKKGFKIIFASKGRFFDLQLINQHKKEIIIAISSHIAKTKSRSKEKTIQKILMDISKMLPYLSKNKGVIPIIITRPIEFEKSWSFTTKEYLEFYKKKFGFIFLTTEFKKNWEDKIIRELLKI